VWHYVLLRYKVVVAAVRGGWWEASQIYREWALAEAVWTRKGNLSTRADNGDMPAWLLRAPLWLKLDGNDPKSEETFAIVDGFRELLGGDGSAVTDIGLHWYHWNNEAFDTEYPVYTARAGFGEAVARLQTPHAGITTRVVPYTNGRLWDTLGPLKTVPNEALCKSRNGSAYSETYGSAANFKIMDPASEFMQDRWSTALANISTRYGTSGMYSDQISCANSQACYNDNATRASSWAAGTQAMLAEMVAKMGPEKVLISESIDQTMLGELHAFLSIYGWTLHETVSAEGWVCSGCEVNANQCGTVLAWQAVYGGWSVNVGDNRYSGLVPKEKGASGKLQFNRTEAAAHRAISAQIFVAGGVMGWYEWMGAVCGSSSCPGGGSAHWENFIGLPDADVAYTRLLASTKVTASKYLVHGRLWRQPEWDVPVPTIQVSDYSACTTNNGVSTCPSCPTAQVLAECWLADDGTFAVVATNHGDVELMLNVTVDLSAVGAARPRLVRVAKVMPALSAEVLELSGVDHHIEADEVVDNDGGKPPSLRSDDDSARIEGQVHHFNG